jgi:GNAT superfamily N-acetyltransferase
VGAVVPVTLVVRRAGAGEIRPLRHNVLRPGHPQDASVYPDDDDATHVAAWDGDLLVGCATVFAEPWAGSDAVAAEPAAWRLRGMAVEPARQGTGVGRQVLGAAVEAAAAAGAPLLWANARVTALEFYLGLGWAIAGPEFVTADTGLPHRPIVLGLVSSSRP